LLLTAAVKACACGSGSVTVCFCRVMPSTDVFISGFDYLPFFRERTRL
jgi:hypothetical protein